jgi:hypothetical protein
MLIVLEPPAVELFLLEPHALRANTTAAETASVIARRPFITLLLVG